ncbi:hypothetical protein Pcinc_016905 [Petrolisthes cinctipes]|uniref:Uncharacterized protein n=1 Tax=Petrolisthes cinctipes TaxID=88211 RepID=A0AAE1FQ49_PETCI|nr:hypothetical protein Pcinc_016905 [Petrolisthes cinctipes]
MVDNLSTEARKQRLLEESQDYCYPEASTDIKKRYKDTALLLFKERQDYDSPRNYLSYGTRRASSISQYGNTPIVIRRSRSSNGGLAMVAEQVPSLRGRSSRSDYALVESKENEEETESEDDYESSERRRLRRDISTLTDKDEDQSITFDTGSISPTSQIQDLCFDESHSQEDNDNKKSITHTNPTHQTHQEDGKDTVNEDGNNNQESDNIIANNTITNDVPASDSKESGGGGALHDSIVKNPSHTIKPDNGNGENDTNNDSARKRLNSEGGNVTRGIECSRDVISFPVNNNDNVITNSSNIDHEAVLREYVQKTTIGKRTLSTPNRSTPETTELQKEKLKATSSYDPKYVDLRIIEPTDIPDHDGGAGLGDWNTSSGEKTLTAVDILKYDDSDDVVFIDANSPPLTRTKFNGSNSCTGSDQELNKCEEEPRLSLETTPTPSRDQSTSRKNSSSTLCSSSKADNESHTRGSVSESRIIHENLSTNVHEATNTGDDILTKGNLNERRSEEPDKPSGLQRLPLRSPTPPRKSPRKAPRDTTTRDKPKERHSSLALPADEETQQQELPNGTRSASPVVKDKELKFFSFSLRREKSKSSSFLHSKKKERKKLPSINLKSQDSQVVEPCVSSTGVKTSVQSQQDASGKRVGIRNMVIDGTIKRNFIVIHPSDESDTLGLAPVSPSQERSVVTTPKALSSVKSHISEVNLEKFQGFKKMFSQGDIKEELSATSIDINESSVVSKNYLRFDRISRSLRVKSNRSSDHKKLGSSKSLSSEPSISGLLECSKPSLSEIDCDSVSVATNTTHGNASTTVSKLCVVM